MNEQTILGILSALLTGCIASIIGAIFTFHARFIRLEQQMKTANRDIRIIRRDLSRRDNADRRYTSTGYDNNTEEIHRWQ